MMVGTSLGIHQHAEWEADHYRDASGQVLFHVRLVAGHLTVWQAVGLSVTQLDALIDALKAARQDADLVAEERLARLTAPLAGRRMVEAKGA